METLATRFCAILRDLRAVIGTHVVTDTLRLPLLTLLWTHLGRTARRFESLFRKWQAGSLPNPRPSRAGQPRKPQPAQLRLPRTRAWVVAELGYRAAGHAGQLQHLLNDSRMVDFIAAVPQAGRLLRPLCAMLGITASPVVPAVLKLPPPPRFRPSPPPPPPYLGIIDPPEAPPLPTGRPRTPFNRVWYV